MKVAIAAGDEMRRLWFDFLSDETGATAIEYGLIGALVSVVLITGARRLGNTLNTKFGAIAAAIGTTVP